MMDCCLVKYFTAFQKAFLSFESRCSKYDLLAFFIIFTAILRSFLYLEYSLGLPYFLAARNAVLRFLISWMIF